MNQSRYQLIALDIDGTLLNSEKGDHPRIQRPWFTGPFGPESRWCSSTYCSFAELEEILQHFLEMRYGICESGALVFDRELEQPIAVHPIPLDIVCQAAEIARQRCADSHFPKGRLVISRHQMEQLDAYQIPLLPFHVPALLPPGDRCPDYCLALPPPLHRKNQSVSPLTQERTVTQSLLSHLPLELVDSEKTSLELSATRWTRAGDCGAVRPPEYSGGDHHCRGR